MMDLNKQVETYYLMETCVQELMEYMEDNEFSENELHVLNKTLDYLNEIMNTFPEEIKQLTN